MGTTYNFGASSINIIMKVFICLSAVLALASCEPFLTSGPAAGPVHAAVGGLVATKRGYRPIALEGYSEDDNQDGFVDPIGQVAPVVYAAPHYGYAAPFGYAGLPYALHVIPAVKAVEAPKVVVKAAPVAYAHAPFAYAAGYPHVYAAHHVVTHPVTYTHTVPAGVLTHTVAGHPVVGGFLPAFAARTVVSGVLPAAPAAEAVVDA